MDCASIPSLDSEITKVRVFRRGAAVTRQARLSARTQGRFPKSLKFDNLPLDLEDASLSLQVLGDSSSAKLPRAVDFKVMIEPGRPLEELPPPDDEELRAAEEKLLELERGESYLKGSVDRWKSVSLGERPEGEKGKPPIESPLAARLELIRLRDQEMARLQGKLRDLEQKIERAEERVRELRNRYEKSSKHRRVREGELRKAVVLTLDSSEAEAESAWIQVEYRVPGARWAPCYSLSLEQGEGGGSTESSLTMRAYISQSSTEDWTDVDISLSTADPERFTEMSELFALRIGRREDSFVKHAWRPPPSGGEELFEDYARFKEQLALVEDESREPRERHEPREPRERHEPREPRGAIEDRRDHSGAPVEGQTSTSLLCDDFAGAAPPPGIAKKRALPGAAAPSAPAKTMACAMFSEAPEAPEAPKFAKRAPKKREPFLDYDRLRLASPDSPKPGSLYALSDEELYREMLGEARWSEGMDLESCVDRAREHALELDRRDLPSRCSEPWDFDGFSHVYRGDHPVSLPSDGQFHSIAVFTTKVDAELSYVAVPRESKEVFRLLRFENPLDAPILGGAVDVSLGRNYLLTSRLDSFPAKGRVELGLGVEQSIRLARNSLFEERESGIFSGSLSLHHEVSIELRNLLEESAAVEVRERLPHVPKDEREIVSVELLSVEPPWERWQQRGEDLLCAYRWQLKLEAGEKKSLFLAYDIHLPSKYELIGGNRRED